MLFYNQTMYLCESCGIWINCDIHPVRYWDRGEYSNNYDIRHDCPRRCQQVCMHATGFLHNQQGWNYYSPLLENPPTNFQPYAVVPLFTPQNWNATSSSTYIGSVADNVFR